MFTLCPVCGHLKMNKILFLRSRNIRSSEGNKQIIQAVLYLTRNIHRTDWLKNLGAGRAVQRLLTGV